MRAAGRRRLDRLELNTVDARFGLRGEQPAPADLLVVAIDDKTFDEWASAGRSRATASPRRWSASPPAIPAVIVYDVQFTEQSDDPRADNR